MKLIINNIKLSFNNTEQINDIKTVLNNTKIIEIEEIEVKGIKLKKVEKRKRPVVRRLSYLEKQELKKKLVEFLRVQGGEYPITLSGLSENRKKLEAFLGDRFFSESIIRQSIKDLLKEGRILFKNGGREKIYIAFESKFDKLRISKKCPKCGGCLIEEGLANKGELILENLNKDSIIIDKFLSCLNCGSNYYHNDKEVSV